MFIMCVYYIPDVTISSDRNPLFSTIGQIDEVDRRFYSDPTTPNCVLRDAKLCIDERSLNIYV